jgi:hypothetical protein
MINAPDTRSRESAAMIPYWEMVQTILGGARALRAASEKYLPKMPFESDSDYQRRLGNSKFTNLFRDIAENLAAKPFAREVGLAGKPPPEFSTFQEDVDAQGNHIHVFASDVFFSGIVNGIDWILVDYTKRPPSAEGRVLSIEQEKALGMRPYWVHIRAKDMLAVYSDMVDGSEQIVHARFRDDEVRRKDGFDEETVERVRIFEREILGEDETGKRIYGGVVWRDMERIAGSSGTGNSNVGMWMQARDGTISLDVIPLVPFMTGRREGSSWLVNPPLQDAAYLQIELYQQESGLKHARELTAFPMLSASGVSPPLDEDGNPKRLPVGPQAVLYAPPAGDGMAPGSWKFIEPEAMSLRFLSGEVEATKRELRELGRQPLTNQSQNMTVVTAAFAASKGNSAIQAWALALKDTIERALALTAKWLGSDFQPEFDIKTDFDLGLIEDKAPEHLLRMRERGDLSARTIWAEFKRRGILSAEFDAATEDTALAGETPSGDEEEIISAFLPGRSGSASEDEEQ